MIVLAANVVNGTFGSKMPWSTKLGEGARIVDASKTIIEGVNGVGNRAITLRTIGPLRRLSFACRRVRLRRRACAVIHRRPKV